MATNVLMPALSPTMEQGKLSRWVKKVGDPVKSGDVIAEIETDKATMEVEAVDEGTLSQILVEEGTDNVAVNTPIGVIAAEGEDASAAPANGSASPNTQASAGEAVPTAAQPGAPDTADKPKPAGIPGSDAGAAAPTKAATHGLAGGAPQEVTPEVPEGIRIGWHQGRSKLIDAQDILLEPLTVAFNQMSCSGVPKSWCAGVMHTPNFQVWGCQ